MTLSGGEGGPTCTDLSLPASNGPCDGLECCPEYVQGSGITVPEFFCCLHLNMPFREDRAWARACEESGCY